MRAAASIPTSLEIAVLGLLTAFCGPSQATSLQQALGDTSGLLTPAPMWAPPKSGPGDVVFGPEQGVPKMDFAKPVRPWGPEPVDRGGSVSIYRDRVRAMGDAPIRIKGTCISACTMFLGAKNACVDRQAILWFHAAHDKDTQEISPEGNRTMAAMWPQPVKNWAEKVKVTERVEFTRGRALTGVELIAMGVPACK